ncbi:D-amino acid dehydrogenase [Pseudoduganella ginsengisoli]|uniref:D-amino acid dehydrogenase n=1 Tax=Pseudoduganella ginsengisoli TaxID=1462440 RepID=A0A6L6Q6K1_9BURK|nr:D-amino acid dehydrogenase [Pseudoduganella ginsengisoli]MTW05069.1 D-amino acid dehydrogenase [Pseudoduganella ginsengisoli]
MKKIAVVGAGITGVTTAYALSKRGFEVTLYDRQRYAAMETSYANGGQLSASNSEVWNHWATVAKGIKWMFTQQAPFLVHPAPTWHKLSWFAQFLAGIPRYRDNTVATVRMAIAAREHLYAWAEEEGIEFDLRRQGILHIYRDKPGFERARAVSQVLAEGGLERRPVAPDEMRAIEPTLHGQYYGGFYTQTDATGDIHKFTTGLAAAALRHGTVTRYGADVADVRADGHGATIACRIDGNTVQERHDAVVICAGSFSRALAARLGDHVNVYPVKGYSVTVQLDDAASQAAAPNASLLDDATKIVCSRLGADRFRVAGTAEFAGYNRDIRAERIAPLMDWIHQCFPQVETRRVIPWTGLRPVMPDMMPKVGRGRSPRVFYNTGHGHLGWTLSAATADMVAQSVMQAGRGV